MRDVEDAQDGRGRGHRLGRARLSGVAPRPGPGSVAAVLAAAALLTGCGGDEPESVTEPAGAETTESAAAGETKTFSEEDYAITFEYPADLEVKDNVSFGATSGSGPQESAGARLGIRDFFAIQKFPLEVAVTEENLEQFIPEGDAVFSEQAGEEVSGEPLEVGGLPALRYEWGPTGENEEETQATMVFDGKTEYLLTCTSTDLHREDIEPACDVALETLELR